MIEIVLKELSACRIVNRNSINSTKWLDYHTPIVDAPEHCLAGPSPTGKTLQTFPSQRWLDWRRSTANSVGSKTP